jgi:hypothetical protein
MPPIYRITSIRNLPNILKDGGLWCDRTVQQRDLAPVSIAHLHIKDRRTQKQVPCGPGGYVADYVPFYFAPRSLMLFVINRGGVEGYQGGQRPILHLVSRVEAVLEAGLLFTFTDGHAEMDISRFFTGSEDLNKIDWEIMRSHYWSDTLEDGPAGFQPTPAAGQKACRPGSARVVLLSMEHPMIVYKSDNLLQADVEALVNTVNTVGVMGKGIALQFKQLLMCPVIKLNIEFREEK